MTKAEEVIQALEDRFLCSCGTSYKTPPPFRFQSCPCGRCWAHVDLSPNSIWCEEMSLASFKVLDYETGWSTWTS